MKTALLCVITLVLLIGGVISQANSHSSPVFKSIAVIELFTSQGCSSCPPADRLLAGTIKEAKKEGRNIFALSFHVDYWNRLGWEDPFSTKEFSQRQSTYASKLDLNSVYTPQMIVNGIWQFVGSNEHDLNDALNRSLNIAPTAAFKILTVNLQNNTSPLVKFTLEGNYTGSTINFALLSRSETTFIKRGENEGITLTNENVVRQFISIPAVAEGEIKFKAAPQPSGNNMAVIAYLQHNSNLKIIGAAMVEFK